MAFILSYRTRYPNNRPRTHLGTHIAYAHTFGVHMRSILLFLINFISILLSKIKIEFLNIKLEGFIYFFCYNVDLLHFFLNIFTFLL